MNYIGHYLNHTTNAVIKKVSSYVPFCVVRNDFSPHSNNVELAEMVEWYGKFTIVELICENVI